MMNKCQFLRFLKDNDCYKLYLKEFYSDNAIAMRKKNFLPINFKDYLNEIKVSFFISNAFAWNQTNNGFEFWLNLSDNWENKTHEYEK